MTFRNFAMCLLSLGLAAHPAATASAGDLFYAAKVGVLAHDVPDLWSGFQIEPDAADINIEIQFAPSASFLGGTLRLCVSVVALQPNGCRATKSLRSI